MVSMGDKSSMAFRKPWQSTFEFTSTSTSAAETSAGVKGDQRLEGQCVWFGHPWDGWFRSYEHLEHQAPVVHLLHVLVAF